MADAPASQALFQRMIPQRPGEGRALLLSFGYFFFVLACYYMLRPVRDEMGIRTGLKNLPWLFTATFVVSFALAPIYAGVISRLKRSVFIPLIYGFLILNILAFWASMAAGIAPAVTAMTFFVWLSVFNVFAVSVFWSFMADVFSPEQAKRLYPTIAAGGSLGGFAGSATVTGLATLIGAENLLFIAAILLGLALACAIALDRHAPPVAAAGRAKTAAKADDKQKVGGGWLAGLRTVLSQPYLGGVAIWVFLLSLSGTFAYFMQADIVSRADLAPNVRTQIFGLIDLTANILIPLIQLTIGRIALQKLGVGLTLGAVAVVFAIGFVCLAAFPILPVLIAFMVVQRAGQFAFSNPAREALFTVVEREDKYKAKNVIDNVVFRGADVANSWFFNLLHTGAGLGLAGIAMVGVPIMTAWFVLSMVLGRTQENRAAPVPARAGA